MELISCFDSTVSTPSSFFGFWQRKIALSFGWGGKNRWLNKISLGLLNQLTLTAKSFSAYTALEYGVIDQVVPSYKLEECIEDWIRIQNKLPKAPVAGLKSCDDEQSIFKSIWFNPEHKEILEKY